MPASFPPRLVSPAAGLRRAAMVALLLGLPPAAIARTILVPFEVATIQQAIDAAATGDVVLVAPGTYAERIDFVGKAIAVVSQDGPATTTLDGGNGGPVVTFALGEGRSSVLSGFTLQRGAGADEGGGIAIRNSSPTVTGNRIVDNRSCAGAGIGVGLGSPLIQGNLISGNSQAFCIGGIGGGGISVRGFSTAEIVDNDILGNVTASDGGGISLFSAGAVAVLRNTIAGNLASYGGGIVTFNQSDHDIVGNVIVGNRALQLGGGVYWLIPVSAPRLVANTIADNDALDGSGVFADGYDAQAQIVGNIIVAAAGQTAVSCGDFNDPNPPTIRFNDVYAPGGGTAYAGICTDQTGIDGNISADPLFADAPGGDFRLTGASPALDAGTDAAPALPSLDRDGRTRIVDGNRDCLVAVDMGAYEFGEPAAASLSPNALDFGGAAVGRTSAPQSLTLANTGSADFSICALTLTGDYAHLTGCGSRLAAGSTCSIAVSFSPTAEGQRSGSVTVQVGGSTAPLVAQLAGIGIAALPPVTVSPANVVLPPGGTQTFTASGGSGTGFRWSLSQAPSGGSIDAATGAYRAGPGDGTIDVVLAADSLGNAGTAAVVVTAREKAGGGCGCTSGSGGAAWLWIAAAGAACLRRRRVPANPGAR